VKVSDGRWWRGWLKFPPLSILAMTSNEEAYNELCCYTLVHGDPSFLHQHVVDAFAAQTADENTKAITLTFALVGLYLRVEKQFSGKQVQRVHTALARRKQTWPAFAPPTDRGVMTVADVLAAPAGPQRDQAIDDWCRSVWQAFRESRETIADLLRTRGLIAKVGGTYTSARTPQSEPTKDRRDQPQH
jgi:hypothetical protein